MCINIYIYVYVVYTYIYIYIDILIYIYYVCIILYIHRHLRVHPTWHVGTDNWESYAQALIGAIKRYDGGVSITTVIEMNFFNTAGEKIVTHESASTATDQYTFNADILQQHYKDKHFYL